MHYQYTVQSPSFKSTSKPIAIPSPYQTPSIQPNHFLPYIRQLPHNIYLLLPPFHRDLPESIHSHQSHLSSRPSPPSPHPEGCLLFRDPFIHHNSSTQPQLRQSQRFLCLLFIHHRKGRGRGRKRRTQMPVDLPMKSVGCG